MAQHERPGAMTAAMRAAGLPRAPRLRVCVVEHGKIITERLLPLTVPIKLGTAESNTLLVRGANAPHARLLFRPSERGPLLCFEDADSGQVGSGSDTFPLSDLVARGLASPAQGGHTWALPERARGKLKFGDVTLLFELVDAPVRPQRPELPLSVRQSLARGVDWLFTCFVLASFALHFAFVAYLENADWPLASDPSRQLETMARLLIEPPPEPPELDRNVPPPIDDNDQVRETRDPEQRQTHKGRDTARPKRDSGQPTHGEDAALAAEAIRQAQLMLVGSLGTAGVLADVLRDAPPIDHAEEILGLVKGTQLATRTSPGLLASRDVGRPGGSENLADLQLAKRGNQGVDEGGPGTERALHYRVAPEDGEEVGGSGDVDPELVTRALRRQLGRIRGCYEQALRHDPSVAGKVAVAFTLEQSGTVSHVRIDEDTTRSASLRACVIATISSLRLERGPQGGSVDFRYPFVFEPSAR
jgi:hypothetical protein